MRVRVHCPHLQLYLLEWVMVWVHRHKECQQVGYPESSVFLKLQQGRGSGMG